MTRIFKIFFTDEINFAGVVIFVKPVPPLQKFISSLPVISDDGFTRIAAEPWFERKTRIFEHYLLSFAANMAGRVDDLIFIDLYAGAGQYALGATGTPSPTPSLLSLSVDAPVTKYIFCEKDVESARALKVRVNKYFRGKNVLILESTPDKLLDRFRYYVPPDRKGYKVSVFCLADPFALDPPFEVIGKLAAMGFNFLIPYTFPLNRRITYAHYLNEHREKLVRFLGGTMSVESLGKSFAGNLQFYKRVVELHQRNMLALGLNASLTVHKLDSMMIELPMFYMGFFSRGLPARRIQKEVQASVNPQFALF